MKELDWANLPFGYMKTDYNVRIYYRDGKWGELEVCSERYVCSVRRRTPPACSLRAGAY